jgi:hypothetical protein
MTKSIIFDVQHLYYLPQYFPVANALKESGVEVEFVLHPEPGYDEVKTQKLDADGLQYHFIPDECTTLSFYQTKRVDWIIFGNVPPFSAADKSTLHAKLALMQHGIGPKACYYSVSEYPFDVRFVDDVFMEESLEKKRDYILQHKADVLVMGNEWEGKFDEFSDVCEVVYLPRTPSVSTTEIIEVIKESQ